MLEPGDFVTVGYADGRTRTVLTRLTDGRVMCCLCWAYTPRDQLAPDPDHPACVTDICQPCRTREEQHHA
jgi:hypothetical protein